MANANSSSRLLTFANIQIAAEAFLQGLPAPGTDEHRTKLAERLQEGNGRTSIFTPTAAAQFSSEFQVIDHIQNTSTGFSGTLFKSRQAGTRESKGSATIYSVND